MKLLKTPYFPRLTLKLLKYWVIFIVIYMTIMSLAHFIPNQFNHHTLNQYDSNIDIYIVSNGVHSDFILPTQTAHIDWTHIFNPHDTLNKTADTWISIGWGDRAFYLNTPTWADLTAKNAFNALSGLSDSAIHISYEPYQHIEMCQKCRKITISTAQYKTIIEHIRSSLPHATQQMTIANIHYWQNDAFYPAIGSYNLFYTCNTWVNNGLKKANIKTALWAILDFSVIHKR